MHCVKCGAEMILVNVVQFQDDIAAPPGLEDHRFKCSGCHKVKQRRVFTRHGREIDAAPDIVPASTVQDERIAALLRCVLAKMPSIASDVG
jgi:transposase-like protein